MPLSRKLALDDKQIAELMTECWNCRIATLGPGDRINLTPMWFGWAAGKIYIYGRGQKIVNLRIGNSMGISSRCPEYQI